MPRALTATLLMIVATAGCRSFDPGEVIFACAEPSDCVQGWACDAVLGVCVRPAGEPAEPDTQPPDASLEPPSCDPPSDFVTATQRCTTAAVPAGCGGNLSGLARTVLEGAVRFSRMAVVEGAPVNQLTRSELCYGPPYTETTWVPAQMAQQLFVLVLAHALRQTDATFDAGPDDAALQCRLEAALGLLESILADPARHADGPALYNVYTLDGEVGHSDFARTVSLLDQTYLILALHTVAAYLQPLPWATELTARARALADPLNLGPWANTVDGCAEFTLGGDDDPTKGPALDRLVTEGRAAIWLAVALGDITPSAGRCLVGRLMAQSIGLPDLGKKIEHVGFFGTSLELITALLPAAKTEQEAGFGERTLNETLRSLETARQKRGHPAFGVTGASLVPGVFSDLVGPVSECYWTPISCSGSVDPSLVVLPSAASYAVLNNPLGVENLQRATCAAASQGLLNQGFGLPNALDLGQGRVHTDDPVSGYLEVSTMATALLVRELGPLAIEGLLRKNPAFGAALEAWGVWLDAKAIEPESDHPTGPISERSCASWKTTLRIPLGSELSLDGLADPAELWLRVSHDTGDGEPPGTLEVLAGSAVTPVALPNTHGPDCAGIVDGWNRFSVVGPLPVPSGKVTLRLSASAAGVAEIDRIIQVPIEAP